MAEKGSPHSPNKSHHFGQPGVIYTSFNTGKLQPAACLIVKPSKRTRYENHPHRFISGIFHRPC